MTDIARRRPDLLPSLGVGLASLMWGVYWLPVRYLGDLGLEGGWAGFAVFGLSGLVAVPLVLFRLRHLRAGGWSLVLTGLITGSAFALYSAALLLSDIVHVLLLFYLTPLWSTLLGLVMLRERLTWSRGGALLLGFAGLLVVLGADRGVPLPRNLGDWMALLSGMMWAYGSLRIYRDKVTPAFEQVLVFCLGGAVMSALVVLLPFDGVGTTPDAGALRAASGPLLLVALLGIWPANWLIMTGARLLSPGRVGILLMGEVLMGVTSAALLAGEPFGLRELLGTVLVLGAGVVEVWRPRAKKSSAALIAGRLE